MANRADLNELCQFHWERRLVLMQDNIVTQSTLTQISQSDTRFLNREYTDNGGFVQKSITQSCAGDSLPFFLVFQWPGQAFFRQGVPKRSQSLGESRPGRL
jgi:hypothetical protein